MATASASHGANSVNPEDKLYLEELAKGFATWDREGAAEDVPEGVRRIWISDTLARLIAERLSEIVERLE